LAGGLAFFGDQEKREVETLGRAAGCGGLLFDLEDNVHEEVREVSLRGGMEAGEIGVGGGPAGLQAGERRCRRSRGGAEADAFLLGAFGEAFFGLLEGGGDAAVAFGIRDVSVERITAKNEIGGFEKLARVCVLGIGVDGGLQIALSGAVIAGVVSGAACAREGRGVSGVEAENFLILGERAGIILSLLEELRGTEMGRGIGRQGDGESHEFGFGLG